MEYAHLVTVEPGKRSGQPCIRGMRHSRGAGTLRGKEKAMIELTEQQVRELETCGDGPPCIVNPRTREAFVLLRVEEYERLKADDYDDSRWTREEMEALAWDAGKAIGWEDMDEYDRLPEKP